MGRDRALRGDRRGVGFAGANRLAFLPFREKLAQLPRAGFPTLAGMDAIAMLRQQVHEEGLSAERLLDWCAAQQRQLHATQQQLQSTQQELQRTLQELQVAQERLATLEKRLGEPPSARLAEPFSVRAEEQRQAARGKKRRAKGRGRRGRRRNQDKLALAARTEAVYPEGVPPAQCRLSHTRPVWRLENHQAVLVAYQVYRGPGKQYGQIPGVLGRSAFGLEIVTEIAYLVYVLGVSFDKVCQVLQFFQNLPLRKGQVDALLYQLARQWEGEFDTLCTLLAHALVVHADETRWSLNSVWALLSEKARVLLFGVHKDAATLHALLDPATFAGLMFSDDAAVYAGFDQAQKCWAHLLRKAIKLTLQDPTRARYRVFTDQLLAIYQRARRVQRDRRLSAAGRARKVISLDNAVFDLCATQSLPATATGLAHEFALLVGEVVRLLFAGALFPFVTLPPVAQPNGVVPPVDGTNNEAERTLRGVALARKTGRTNKTLAGARRQTIVTSVLESLRLYLPSFTLASVLAELQRWWTAGQSCFAAQRAKLNLPLPEESVLERLLPHPSG